VEQHTNFQDLVDLEYVDDLRNYLFGGVQAEIPTSQPFGIDLAATNIQRGRDIGLPGYGEIRSNWGLATKTTWEEVSSNPQFSAALRAAYNVTGTTEAQQIADCDCYVCGLAEDHLGGVNVGEMFQTIIRSQYTRVRDADRFWFENPWANFTTTELNEIRSVTLAEIILRNTNVQSIQCQVFAAEQSGFGCTKNMTTSLTSSATPSSTSPITGKIWDVTVNSNYFSPAAVVVNVGDTVMWTRDSGAHTVTQVILSTDTNPPADPLWDYPPTGPNSDWTTFSYTFNTVGVFNYICRPHVFLGMRGNVTVNAATTGTSPTSTTGSGATTTSSTSGTSVRLPSFLLLVICVLAKLFQ